MQVEYSLLARTPEGELLPMAQERGIGVLPWGLLRGATTKIPTALASLLKA